MDLATTINSIAARGAMFWAATGSVAFTAMTLDSPAHWLILGGFLINAGAPPLSAWVPDAYPEASPSGAVFLSAFTTKLAIYALARGFPGTEILVPMGVVILVVAGTNQRRWVSNGRPGSSA